MQIQITGNLDPIFCTGMNNFSYMKYFSSDCAANPSNSSDVYFTTCSCCTDCCQELLNLDQISCITLSPQPPECDNQCVACADEVISTRCQACPKVFNGDEVVGQ
mmetsp:Transcript_5682/g.16829  ORF Transcript_5682/g.16829 Transcript_5682/m.16829 type:complete len:105 (-) Transcript_5682:343-657(-)